MEWGFFVFTLHKGDFYKATTIAELEKIVAEIKEK